MHSISSEFITKHELTVKIIHCTKDQADHMAGQHLVLNIANADVYGR